MKPMKAYEVYDGGDNWVIRFAASNVVARREGDVHTPQVDRLFDLAHSSKIEFVEQAAKALGKSLSVSLV